MSFCLSTWLLTSSQTPQGNHFEFLLFWASVGACNLILHIHVVINWQLSKQGICWPVLQNRIMGSGVGPLRLGVSFFYYPLTSYILLIFKWSQARVLFLFFSLIFIFSLFLFLFFWSQTFQVGSSNLSWTSCGLSSYILKFTVQVSTCSTVQPLFRGHPRDLDKCPLNTGWAGVFLLIINQQKKLFCLGNLCSHYFNQLENVQKVMVNFVNSMILFVEFPQVQYMDLCEMGFVYNTRCGQVHFES